MVMVAEERKSITLLFFQFIVSCDSFRWLCYFSLPINSGIALYFNGSIFTNSMRIFLRIQIFQIQKEISWF